MISTHIDLQRYILKYFMVLLQRANNLGVFRRNFWVNIFRQLTLRFSISTSVSSHFVSPLAPFSMLAPLVKGSPAPTLKYSLSNDFSKIFSKVFFETSNALSLVRSPRCGKQHRLQSQRYLAAYENFWLHIQYRLYRGIIPSNYSRRAWWFCICI